MFSEYILKLAPRVLSQVDRDRHSKNYGDCDRNHWHLKVRDFSSAILQQTGLALALLYQLDFEGNLFYGRQEVREWAQATVCYWRKIQLKDGSFNEYYPNEHGFPPTAFSLYAMCEVYRRLEMEDEGIKEAFRKTARYLVRHIEEKAYNQEIASITALYAAYQILREPWILEGMEKKLVRILSLQSDEGWFSEYGGADIGYMSVSLDMLAEYYVMSGDERVKKPLEKMIDFLQYFIHPDGTAGGEYASRNTIYFLPGGLQTMACQGNGTAEAMLQKLYRDTDRAFYFMDGVDDRYFSHYILHSFLRALEKRTAYQGTYVQEKLPCERDQERYFAQAGILCCTRGDRYVIVGAKKGGVVRAFAGGSACFEDYGYRTRLEEGKVAATSWQSANTKVEYEEHRLRIKGHMNLVKQKVATPIMLMGLRGVSAVVGNRIIGMLKRMIILVDQETDIAYERRIEITDDGIRMTDEITSPRSIDLECADPFSLRHVASGRFFATADLGTHSRNRYPQVQKIRIGRKYGFDSRKLSEKVLE